MFGKSMRFALAVVLLVVLPCAAQGKPEKRAKRERDRERKPNIRELVIRDVDGFFDEMKEELRLTDSQQAEFKRLLESYKTDTKTLQSGVSSGAESGKKFAQIREQMDEARKANDQARMQQLLEQMKTEKTQREAQEEPIRAGLEQANKNLHDQLAQRLGEKQKQDFETLWKDATEGKGGRTNRINPKALHDAFMKLPGITEDQKKQAEELFKTHDKAIADVRGSAARNKVSQNLYNGVLALLTPEQKQKLETEFAAKRSNERGEKKQSKGG